MATIVSDGADTLEVGDLLGAIAQEVFEDHFVGRSHGQTGEADPAWSRGEPDRSFGEGDVSFRRRIEEGNDAPPRPVMGIARDIIHAIDGTDGYTRLLAGLQYRIQRSRLDPVPDDLV